jgi:hypothetical protein
MRFNSPTQALGASYKSRSGNLSERPRAEQVYTSQRNGLERLSSDCDNSLTELLGRPKITGAAIAVAVNNHLECVCARGINAPPLGSRCYPGVGLTGLGFSSGRLQLCNDVQNDSRVDQEACADLNAKSVLVVPLKNGPATAGILEVLSSEPNTFDWRAIRFITRLSKQLHVSAVSSGLATASCDGKVRSRTSDLDLQEILHAAWIVKKNIEVTDEVAEIKQQPATQQFSSHETAELPRQVIHPKPEEFDNLDDTHGNGKYLAMIIAMTVLLSLYIFHLQAGPVRSRVHSAPAVPKGGRPYFAVLPENSTAERAIRSQRAVRSQNESPTQEFTQSETVASKAVGKPAPHSYEDAMRQFEADAIRGDADASWNLGLAYLRGIGVPRNENRAAEWLKKAANLDDTRAQTALSDCYARGIGVQRDYIRAYTWASIAARQAGSRDDRLGSLRQLMNKAELDDANRRVDAWFAQKSSNVEKRKSR